MSEPMFVTVRYGDDQRIILNSVCPTGTFIEWIKKKCNFDQNAILDLVDAAGQLKNISCSPRSYVNDLVTMGETYILILVEKENGNIRYVSLLDNLDKLYPEVYNILGSLSGRSKHVKENKAFKKPKSVPKVKPGPSPVKPRQ